MASVPMVLQQIRRARREARQAESTGQFRKYRPDYREILAAAREAGGEGTLDDIMEWATGYTKQEGQLPEPEIMRTHVREMLKMRGIEIPAESQLREH